MAAREHIRPMSALRPSAVARPADPATDDARSLVAAPADATRDRPLRPEDDPFVTAPADLAALHPGTIIRAREVEVALLGIVPQRVSAWQLLYRSNDLNAAAEVALTTVLLPHGADPTEPRPLLAYQCAIDAISSVCFPSYALRRHARSWGAVPPLELLLLAGLLRRGWALSVADHEGLQGRFGAPREPGYRTLDGIRAALDFAPLGLQPATPVGIFGYSGGGMASSWAAEMAPEYAPELNLVGAVMGSPVGDPGETFLRLNGGFFAGFPAIVVAGLRTGYSGLNRVIDEHASSAGRRRLKQLEGITTIGAVAKFRGDDFDDYLDTPLADVLGTPEVLHVFADLRLGHRTPLCPLLIVQGVHDQVIHVDDIDPQVQRYVDAGATVRYVRDRASEHNSLYVLAMPLALAWLSDRFAGRPAPTGTQTVRSVAFSLTAVRGYLAMTIAAALTVLGRPTAKLLIRARGRRGDPGDCGR
jgi:pimeloyl-ACP methyl ester carboxylesterase